MKVPRTKSESATDALAAVGSRTHRGNSSSRRPEGDDLVKRARASGHEASFPVALTGAADRRSRLSEGALVQASVRARLLGIPLLRLDATIALMPAAITAPASPRVGGDSLAEAVRSINDGAKVLAELRRNGGR